jgi:hypothetical protein
MTPARDKGDILQEILAELVEAYERNFYDQEKLLFTENRTMANASDPALQNYDTTGLPALNTANYTLPALTPDEMASSRAAMQQSIKDGKLVPGLVGIVEGLLPLIKAAGLLTFLP